MPHLSWGPKPRARGVPAASLGNWQRRPVAHRRRRELHGGQAASTGGAQSPGFTLIELLVVIAIISVLAAIGFSVNGQISEEQRRVRTVSQLQALGTALEDFKRAYGDYPWIGEATSAADAGNGPLLLQALTGELRLEVATTGGTRTVSMVANSTPGRPLIEKEKFIIQGTGSGAYLADAWGRPLYYSYVSEGSATAKASWRRDSFILASAGPDGLIDLTEHANGELPNRIEDYFTDDNEDNLLHGIDR